MPPGSKRESCQVAQRGPALQLPLPQPPSLLGNPLSSNALWWCLVFRVRAGLPDGFIQCLLHFHYIFSFFCPHTDLLLCSCNYSSHALYSCYSTLVNLVVYGAVGCILSLLIKPQPQASDMWAWVSWLCHCSSRCSSEPILVFSWYSFLRGRNVFLPGASSICKGIIIGPKACPPSSPSQHGFLLWVMWGGFAPFLYTLLFLSPGWYHRTSFQDSQQTFLWDP